MQSRESMLCMAGMHLWKTIHRSAWVHLCRAVQCLFLRPGLFFSGCCRIEKVNCGRFSVCRHAQSKSTSKFDSGCPHASYTFASDPDIRSRRIEIRLPRYGKVDLHKSGCRFVTVHRFHVRTGDGAHRILQEL